MGFNSGFKGLIIAGFRGACHYIYNIEAIKTAIPSEVLLWIGINKTNVDEKKRTAVVPQNYVVRSFEIGDVGPDRLSHSTQC